MRVTTNETKKKLQKLGYGEKHKKKLPYIPNIIGIITSSTGAVIEDIKKELRRGFLAIFYCGL